MRTSWNGERGRLVSREESALISAPDSKIAQFETATDIDAGKRKEVPVGEFFAVVLGISWGSQQDDETAEKDPPRESMEAMRNGGL